MIDTRFDTSIDLRGEIENYRQVALIKYYKMLLEIDPKKDRLTLLAVLRCIDKLERHSQERKRPRPEENASRWNTRLALPKEKPTLSESRAIRHRVHTVPCRPRRDIRHTRGTGGTRTIRSLPARSAQETRGKKKRRERKSRLGNRIDPRKQRRKRIRFIRKKTRRHLRIIRKWIREPGKEPYESHRYTGISTQSPFASFRQYLVRNLRKNSDR